jgi:TolA-binding protein
MITAELHPEDLLERDARGELSPAERARLDAHLARCTACRLERAARADFLREGERLAAGAPLDVQRLLAGVLAAPRATEPAPIVKPRRSQRVAGLLLTGIIVTVAGLAAAARWSGPRAAGVTTDAAHDLTSPRGAPPGPSAAARGDSAPPMTRTPPDERTAAPAAAVAASTSRTAIAVMPVSFPLAPTPREPETAALFFQRANEARRSGQHSRAAETYRALIARYPASAETQASLVALGRMLLDDGDATGALRCFDDYLRGGGPLTEDVMLGRALALQHLGRGDESAAWTALLGAYPNSVHAERARRRLLDLGKM